MYSQKKCVSAVTINASTLELKPTLQSSAHSGRLAPQHSSVPQNGVHAREGVLSTSLSWKEIYINIYIKFTKQ